MQELRGVPTHLTVTLMLTNEVLTERHITDHREIGMSTSTEVLKPTEA